MYSASAARTISVLRYLQSERIGAQVRHLADEFHRGFCVAIFKFAHRRAHAAQGLQAAIGADCFRSALRLTNFAQAAEPALLKTA
jgi:hypothetical protein